MPTPDSPAICRQHYRFRRFGDMPLRSRVYDKTLCHKGRASTRSSRPVPSIGPIIACIWISRGKNQGGRAHGGQAVGHWADSRAPGSLGLATHDDDPPVDGEIVVQALLDAQKNPVIRLVSAAKLVRRPRALNARVGSVTIPGGDEALDAEFQISQAPTAHTEIQWRLLP